MSKFPSLLRQFDLGTCDVAAEYIEDIERKQYQKTNELLKLQAQYDALKAKYDRLLIESRSRE